MMRLGKLVWLQLCVNFVEQGTSASYLISSFRLICGVVLHISVIGEFSTPGLRNYMGMQGNADRDGRGLRFPA